MFSVRSSFLLSQLRYGFSARSKQTKSLLAGLHNGVKGRCERTAANPHCRAWNDHVRRGLSTLRSSTGSTDSVSRRRRPEYHYICPMLIKGTAEALANTESRRYVDLLVLDLEDSVPMTMKATVRDRLHGAIIRGDVHLEAHQTLSVRVNSVHSHPAMGRQDIESIVHPHVKFLVIPKVIDGEGVADYAALALEAEKRKSLPTGHTKFLIVVESARNAFNILELLSGDQQRVMGGVLGLGDFAMETGGRPVHTNLAFKCMETRLILAAHHLQKFCLASPFLRIDDLSLMVAAADREKRKGLTGYAALTPAQAAVIHHRFLSKDTPEYMVEESAEGIDFVNPSALPTATPSASPKAAGVPTNQTSSHAIPLKVGEIQRLDNERSVKASWLTTWTILLFNSSNLQTAKRFGWGLPYSLQLMLCTAPLEHLRYVTGGNESVYGQVIRLDNAILHHALQPGDVMRIFTKVICISTATASHPDPAVGHGEATAAVAGSGGMNEAEAPLEVETRHAVVNQDDQLCFSVRITTRLPQGITVKPSVCNKEAESINHQAPNIQSVRELATAADHPPLIPGQVMIHPLVRSFLSSDQALLGNFLRTGGSSSREGVIHPVFALCAVLNNSNKDIGDCVQEVIISSQFLVPVQTDQTVVSVTYVTGVQSSPLHSDLEEVELVTLGLVDVNVEDVERLSIPATLFSTATSYSHTAVQQDTKAYCPFLQGRIALRVVRKVTRLRPSVHLAEQCKADEHLVATAARNGWFLQQQPQ